MRSDRIYFELGFMITKTKLSWWFLFCIFILFFSVAFTTKSSALDNCSASQTTQIAAVQSSLKVVLPKAILKVPSNVSPSSDYKTWFGSYDSSAAKKVKDTLIAIKLLVDSSALELRCGLVVEEGCVQGQAAYVDVSLSRKRVNFCSDYFTYLPAVQTGMFAHELVHLAISSPGDMEVAHTKETAQALNPIDASVSAYNYGFWIESLY